MLNPQIEIFMTVDEEGSFSKASDTVQAFIEVIKAHIDKSLWNFSAD